MKREVGGGIIKMKIAIIGAGVAGITVLIEIVNHPAFDKTIEIDLYDTSELFGTGLPYQQDYDSLLNQEADTMSILLDEPLDFVQWAEENAGYSGIEKEHLPRPLYGRYLKERLGNYIAESGATVYFQTVDELTIIDQHKISLLAGKDQRVYDAVHLCTGHLPYADPYRLRGHSNFVYNPYPLYEKLGTIPKTSSVGIIGTGLTALDLLRYLKEKKDIKQTYLFSLTGKFSTVRGNEKKRTLHYLTGEATRQHIEKNDGFLSLDLVLEWFKKECLSRGMEPSKVFEKFGAGTKESMEYEWNHKDEIGLFQSLIHQLDDFLPDIWNAFTEKDKTAFKELYEKKIEAFRSPMPGKSVSKLLEWLNSGAVLVQGGMKTVQTRENGFLVSFDSEEKIAVDYLVNAAGQHKMVQQSAYNSQLLNDLLNKRILQPEPYGGIQVCWPVLSVVSQRYGVLRHLKAHGQLIHGVEFGNNTVKMLRKSSRIAVQDTFRRLNRRGDGS